MQYSKAVASLSSLLLFLHTPHSAAAFYHATDAETSEALVASYPDLLEGSDRAGNPLILCPFLRMLERSGRLDDVLDSDTASVKTSDLKDAAEEFGCDSTTGCGPVIDLVSSGQSDSFFSWLNPFETRQVDLERLWDAPPVSHECGFTFEKGLGEEGVSATRLESTLAKLLAKANASNELVYQDILDVKLAICEEEGVEITGAGSVEAQLIFAYLGGIERGFVDYSDVEGFLQVNNVMPAVKAQKEITALYLLQVN